ncbi:MAG: arginase [Halieaceae bacterium]|jgi:arginase
MMSKVAYRSALVLCLYFVLYPGAPLSAKDVAPPPVPEALQPLVDALPADKRDYLLSEAALGFAGTGEKLFLRLKGRSAAEIEAVVDAMRHVEKAKLYNPETDMGAIPLNTDSSEFNSWKLMNPRALASKREPGPIYLSYYTNNRRQGVRTFANAPLAIYPEDLIAGEVEVAIVGAPLDMGSYYRGQKFGPQAMRNQDGASGMDMATMIDASRELKIVDYGDIAIDNMSSEISVHHVRERIAEIAATGAIPFIVGGDHSLEYPDIAGLADVHGKGSFGVVHFDSHFDAGKDRPHYITHGQPVYRAIKEGHVKAENFIQVGLRGPWPGAWGFEWMRNNGMRYHTMPEVEKKGWPAVMEAAVREAREGTEKLFISFDVDVLDPAFVPGTGTPVPGGLTMREAIPIVRALCSESEMIGFEIVELDPLLDGTYRSALNANYIMHACLTGIAMRKKGITDGAYLSELSTEHMQPEAGLEAQEADDMESVDIDYGGLPR